MKSCCTVLACATAVLPFLIFCAVYPITASATYVQARLSCLLTILVLSRDIPFGKIRASNVDGLLVLHIETGLLAAVLTVNCEYLPT